MWLLITRLQRRSAATATESVRRSGLRPARLTDPDKSGEFICYRTGQVYLLPTGSAARIQRDVSFGASVGQAASPSSAFRERELRVLLRIKRSGSVTQVHRHPFTDQVRITRRNASSTRRVLTSERSRKSSSRSVAKPSARGLSLLTGAVGALPHEYQSCRQRSQPRPLISASPTIRFLLGRAPRTHCH